MMGLLEFKELSKEYRRGGRAFNAVNNVSFSIEPGEFISIIGRSGSGKTTLLNMGAGLLKPTQGSVFFEGQDIHRLKDKEISFLRNAKIGYVPQGMSLLSNFTVFDNVCIPWFLFKRGGGIKGIGGIEGKAFLLLEKVGISHLASSYPKELSGGEMRRVAIARSLINDPLLLIADEPTSDLDAETTAEIMRLLSGIALGGTAVLIVTHELDTLGYGNKTYAMNEGNLAPA
ncbi:MAG: ABC transporter ATP-binding protein [Spirochaetaceae bacterium]|jgi:putative ABC transport system ATP-binding protein|nr:ABC transporter ATP-binding protein [Spirochaetaceae bacterium]